MLESLQVKVKTLAAEAGFIRKLEVKQKHIRAFESHTQSFKHDKDKPKPEPREWPDAKENTQELYDEATMRFFNLYRHRTVALRKEARLSHLAYAFLRGVPYSTVEQSTHDVLDVFEDQHEPELGRQGQEKRLFDKVRVMAKRFAPDSITKDQDFAQKWAEWIDEAREHVLKQHPKMSA